MLLLYWIEHFVVMTYFLNVLLKFNKTAHLTGNGQSYNRFMFNLPMSWGYMLIKQKLNQLMWKQSDVILFYSNSECTKSTSRYNSLMSTKNMGSSHCTTWQLWEEYQSCLLLFSLSSHQSILMTKENFH